MTVLSLSLGVLFAMRTTAVVIVALSGLILILACVYAGLTGAWLPLGQAAKVVACLQVGYVLCVIFRRNIDR